MNERQSKAYRAPFIGDPDPYADHGHSAYHERHLGVPMTVMVTVDVGDSASRHLGLQAAWHVSVSCWPRAEGAGDPILASDWNMLHQLASLRAFNKNIKGVGERGHKPILMAGSYANHFYRPLSAGEVAGLPRTP